METAPSEAKFEHPRVDEELFYLCLSFFLEDVPIMRPGQ